MSKESKKFNYLVSINCSVRHFVYYFIKNNYFLTISDTADEKKKKRKR